VKEQITEQLEPLAGMGKVDGAEFTKTLTGFDELAIERAFRRPLDDMPSIASLRALLFIRLRREGAKDTDAFKVAMSLTLGRMEDLFERPRDEDDDEGEGDVPGEASTPA
jgi:hypothetical protein